MIEALRRSAAHVLVADVDVPQLDDDAVHHLARVLRLRRGQHVTVTDGAGRWRTAVFTGVGVEAAGAVETAAGSDSCADGGRRAAEGRPPGVVGRQVHGDRDRPPCVARGRPLRRPLVGGSTRAAARTTAPDRRRGVDAVAVESGCRRSRGRNRRSRCCRVSPPPSREVARRPRRTRRSPSARKAVGRRRSWRSPHRPSRSAPTCCASRPPPSPPPS